jgi:hypothetical protein
MMYVTNYTLYSPFGNRTSYSGEVANIFQGASPREQVLEACRRNNTELLQGVIDGLVNKTSDKASKKRSHEEQVADLLNNAVDGIGNHCLHLAATYGSCKFWLYCCKVELRAS